MRRLSLALLAVFASVAAPAERVAIGPGQFVSTLPPGPGIATVAVAHSCSTGGR